jgi:hypothetical protein
MYSRSDEAGARHSVLALTAKAAGARKATLKSMMNNQNIETT